MILINVTNNFSLIYNKTILLKKWNFFINLYLVFKYNQLCRQNYHRGSLSFHILHRVTFISVVGSESIEWCLNTFFRCISIYTNRHIHLHLHITRTLGFTLYSQLQLYFHTVQFELELQYLFFSTLTQLIVRGSRLKLESGQRINHFLLIRKGFIVFIFRLYI